MSVPFAWARAYRDRLYVSGHGAQAADGSPAGPFGAGPRRSRWRTRSTPRQTALAMLGAIEREIGDVDRVAAWLVVHRLVNAEPGYAQTTSVINPSPSWCWRSSGTTSAAMPARPSG